MTAHGNDLEARRLDALACALDGFAPFFERAYAPRAIGADHLGQDGPALVVGNHSGGPLALIEPLVLAHALRPSLPLERMPHLLLHEAMWHSPLAATCARLGAVRASEENASGLLTAGRSVLVYPGGDREAFRSFRDRDRLSLGSRRGYLRLAITHGVPIVPVVTAGMHSGLAVLHDGHALARRLPLARRLRVGVLPITISAPFGIGIGVPPPYLPLCGRVRIRVLPPIRFSRSGAEAARDEAYLERCHEILVSLMQRTLDALSLSRRAERREALHRTLDRALETIEHLTRAGRPPALGGRVGRGVDRALPSPRGLPEPA